jgi:diguanylate cyclase (GGDEF)-like protein
MKSAVAVVLISILAFAGTVPFANVPLPQVSAFIPSYESALAIIDLVTAVLLFGRVNRRGSCGMLALGCGYLFCAVIIVLHGLSFPGVFSKSGLLGANDQTTAWLYLFWHAGFPLFVIVYALLPERYKYSVYLRKQTGMAVGFSSAVVVAIVAALLFLATVGHNLLPKIIDGGNYALLVTTGASPIALGWTALALWRRPKKTAIDLWLMVVMSAWILDVMLSAVVTSSRYDLGGYGGRSYGLVASCCLLIFLLLEMNRLHGRLMDALAIAGTLEEYLTFRAENDSLTGLPNRALFYDRLETAMTRCRRSKNPMALLYLDIDHFKKINNGLGHAAGDELLQSFSQRLLKCVRASDTVARLGGDEFTVILENIASRDMAKSVVEKLIGVLRAPYRLGSNQIPASASIGLAYFAEEELTADGLIKHADAALYKAKHAGRNRYRVYESEAA